jgi:hypothetical protein
MPMDITHSSSSIIMYKICCNWCIKRPVTLGYISDAVPLLAVAVNRKRPLSLLGRQVTMYLAVMASVLTNAVLAIRTQRQCLTEFTFVADDIKLK